MFVYEKIQNHQFTHFFLFSSAPKEYLRQSTKEEKIATFNWKNCSVQGQHEEIITTKSRTSLLTWRGSFLVLFLFFFLISKADNIEVISCLNTALVTVMLSHGAAAQFAVTSVLGTNQFQST